MKLYSTIRTPIVFPPKQVGNLFRKEKLVIHRLSNKYEHLGGY